MARSSPLADSPEALAAFAALAALERCWRDALSYVAGGEADAAAAEVERAGELLAGIGSLDVLRARLSDGELVSFAARMQRISALHAELLDASRRAQGVLADEMGAARRGRDALEAYAPAPADSFAAPRCDQIG